jgi:hypothetical protein
MKRINYLLMAATALVIASCNLAGGDDYANLATDMCGCVNESADGLAPEIMDAVIAADGDMNKFQNGLMAFQQKNPEKAQQGMQGFMEMGTKMETCIKKLSEKYEYVYSHHVRREIDRKIMDALKTNGDCKFTYSLMKIGLSAQK